uniref:Glutaredoxin domain-containing protein n=1 Tax=Setaria digitata TaxID=48799 RepID=A0A915PP30_9BILA
MLISTQDYLQRRSGGVRTVPQLYVNGRFIGDYDTTERKEQSGELARVFSQAGITPKKFRPAFRKREC